jgi:hypothetical protein
MVAEGAHMTRARLAAVVWLALGAGGCGGGDPVVVSNEDTTLPDPGPDGLQLKTGLIPVKPGEEVQNCYFFEVPSEMLVNRITLAQNIGSHHMNVFRVKTIKNLDGAPGEIVQNGECWTSTNWADWPLVANSQSAGIEDWNLPEGVALRFTAGEKIMLQSHYVNADTQQTPTRGNVVVNFYGSPPGTNVQELGTMFATNQSIEICPGDIDRKFETTCGIDREKQITVVAASGHFHSRGRRFTMRTYDDLTGETGPDFYESQSWDEPPFLRDLSVQVPPGDKVQWTCEFAVKNDECGDPANRCCFTFGGKVESQEHCNAFIYYYPRGASDRNCF